MPDVKFGRRPPKNHPALLLGPSLTGIAPAHPVSVDYLASLSNWKVLGNDQYGDCVSVGVANMRRSTTAALSTETYASLNEVLDFYKTQNPSFPAEDNGMDMQTALEYLVAHGGPDGVKALAFAKVDHANLAEMDAAVAIFGGVFVGINVLAANMTEFDRQQPWDYIAGSPVDGGHAVWAGGYNAADIRNDIRFITWAKETSFTDAFVSHQMDEAWVVVWPEHLGSKAFLAGVDLTQMAADYAALTGRPFPVQSAPANADATLAAATRTWAAARHSGANRLAANAVLAWLRAKNL